MHRQKESQRLFQPVMRSWLYGAKLAQPRVLPDAELVAVAVLLHDLGRAWWRSDRRFEVVGADIGRLCPFP
jgi:HD superfamily phosphodiesterase